ncbi:threonine ammonia-lyase IlvA [soil metagenome]
MLKAVEFQLQMPSFEETLLAHDRLKPVVNHTPLLNNINLSYQYQANIFLKREDLQIVRSYKIRGAFNLMSSMDPDQLEKGVVCASAGNHAQGVAYSCQKLKVKGIIFMPHTTPSQKVNQVRMFGREYAEIKLVGDTFDDSFLEAKNYCNQEGKIFIHPFDDPKVIEGQGTVGLEILEDAEDKIDYLFLPIGGGGLAAGVATVFHKLSPHTKIIGVEPTGAAAMKASIDQGENITLEKIDKFVDGAAVKRVGDITFTICNKLLSKVITVPEGKICTTILKLYNEEAIVAEPAGALTIAALDFLKDEIKGKNVVCVVSGSNNDITRTEEIKERSLLYEGLKHYFIIRFPQRAGALREFLNDVLSPTDDIAHFEYSKKNSREKGPAIVGIEVQQREDFDKLIQRLDNKGFPYEYLNDQQNLFQYLI